MFYLLFLSIEFQAPLDMRISVSPVFPHGSPTNHIKVGSAIVIFFELSFFPFFTFLHIKKKKMNNSTYLAVSEQLFATSADDSNCPTKRENNAPVLSWPSSVINNNNEPVNLMSVVDPTEFDMSNLIWQVNNTDSPPSTQSSSNDLSNSLISYFDNLFEPWNNNNIQVPATIKEEWENINNPVKQEPQEFTLSYPEQQQPFKLPLTPPFDTNNSNNNRLRNSFGFTAEPMPISSTATDFNELYSNTILQQVSREITPPTSATVSSFASSSNSPLSNVSTPPPPAMAHQYLPQQYLINHLSSTPTKSRGAAAARRKSADGHSAPTRTYRRRASSHPSVASVVSLSAHEPVSRIIGGIEHITFLYSHDRLVKEYTVRTDIDSVNLDDIPLDFRVPNAVSFYAHLF
jgi:hypothetical protein